MNQNWADIDHINIIRLPYENSERHDRKYVKYRPSELVILMDI